MFKLSVYLTSQETISVGNTASASFNLQLSINLLIRCRNFNFLLRSLEFFKVLDNYNSRLLELQVKKW